MANTRVTRIIAKIIQQYRWPSEDIKRGPTVFFSVVIVLFPSSIAGIWKIYIFFRFLKYSKKFHLKIPFLFTIFYSIAKISPNWLVKLRRPGPQIFCLTRTFLMCLTCDLTNFGAIFGWILFHFSFWGFERINLALEMELGWYQGPACSVVFRLCVVQIPKKSGIQWGVSSIAWARRILTFFYLFYHRL